MRSGGFARAGVVLFVLVSCGNTQKQTPATEPTDSGGAEAMAAAGGEDASDNSSVGGGSAGDSGVIASHGGAEAGAGSSAGGEPSTGGAGGGEAAEGPPSCQGLAKDCGADADQDCCTAELVPGRANVKIGNGGDTEDLEPFLLDRYEVTVGRYRKFVAAVDAGWRPQPGEGKHPTDKRFPGWNAEMPESFLPREVSGFGVGTWTDEAGANENYPVNALEWRKAFAFCIWDGGRLPTSLEWREAAQGGAEQRYYPWSSPATSKVIDSTYAAYGCMNACTLEALREVGTSPLGNGRFGHADLGGNVWEWIADKPAESEGGGTARGGGFFDTELILRVGTDVGEPPHAGQGVRCARSAEPG